MSYLLLVVVFGVASLALLVLARRRLRGGAKRAMLVAFIALAVLTIVFDSLMIASDLFSYGQESLTGIYLGLAPIEDLAYPAVALMVVVAVWSLLPARRGASGDTAGHASDSASTSGSTSTDGEGRA